MFILFLMFLSKHGLLLHLRLHGDVTSCEVNQLCGPSAEAQDVPEEQQPEEPKDSSVQNVQLKHQQETSNQDLDSEEEPAQSAAAQVLVMEPVDSDVRVNDGEPAQKEDQEEEEDPVKGGNVCEDQGETQQVRLHSCQTHTQKCVKLQNHYSLCL